MCGAEVSPCGLADITFTKPSFSPCAALPWPERHLSDLELEALFLRGALREADAGDLRVAVSAAREKSPFSACGREQTVLRRSQSPRNSQRARATGADNITAAKMPATARFVAVVNLDKSLLIETDFKDPRRTGETPIATRAISASNVFSAPLVRDGNLDTFANCLGLGSLVIGQELNALLRERFFQSLRNLRILSGQDVRSISTNN